MRRNALPAILLAALALAPGAGITEVAAKGGSQLLPKQSRDNKVSTTSSKAEIKAICAEIVERQDGSSIGRRDASSLDMHGMIMGVTCLKVDYYKALVLAHDFRRRVHLEGGADLCPRTRHCRRRQGHPGH